MRKLEMKFAGGGIVRHLGLQNYKGAVPALAELIANAWDADANIVKIKIPFNKSFSSKDKIIVEDNGHGMLFDDCDNKYLVIGRNRRLAENTDKTSKGRPLMAHKGLGKLAGFGIAKVVEVKTISKGKLTHFRMSFDDLDKLEQGVSYYPKMIADEKPTDQKNKTEIILKDLTLQRAINKEKFLSSMASRFSIFSEKFQLHINEVCFEKKDFPLQFRFPEKKDEEVEKIKNGFGLTTLADGVKIKWWIGFALNTIKQEEYYGISVLTRGRIAQDPWDFNLAGGMWAQHGLRYMTGQIIAEFVDEGLSYDSDTIITNRSGINWEKPNNRLLYDWARKKIRVLCLEWSNRRGNKTYEEVTKTNPELINKIERFQPREKKELTTALRKLAQIPTIKPKRLAQLYEHVIDGYQDKVMVDIINEINEVPISDRERIIDILLEFDILEAIRVHKLVSSHVLIIRRFSDMIEHNALESEIHEHIKKYPWLIGLKYQAMDHDRALKTVLEDKFKILVSDETGRKRPDIVVMRASEDVIVIELKKPSLVVGLDEINQIKLYVDYLREWLDSTNTEGLIGRNLSSKDVKGYLIAYELRDDIFIRREKSRLEKDGINICKWKNILSETELQYNDYLNLIKSKAPMDDPRIQELEKIN